MDLVPKAVAPAQCWMCEKRSHFDCAVVAAAAAVGRVVAAAAAVGYSLQNWTNTEHFVY